MRYFLPLTTKRVFSFEECYAHQCFVNQIKTGEKKRQQAADGIVPPSAIVTRRSVNKNSEITN